MRVCGHNMNPTLRQESNKKAPFGALFYFYYEKAVVLSHFMDERWFKKLVKVLTLRQGNVFTRC